MARGRLFGRATSRGHGGAPGVVALAALALACSSSGKVGGGPGAGDAGGQDSSGAEGGGPDGSSADSGSKDASGDAAGPGEAGVDSAAADGGGCGEFTGDTVPTCSGDGSSLGQCAGGVPNVQVCADGCLHAYGQNPASCLLPTATNFSCTGSYGTEPVDDGNYYMSSFGCWVDTSGGIQTDPGDNCIPSCLSKAIAAGLCPPGTAGPACEESINWYTADAARFGCLARLRVTNPANGKKLIAVALDYGPGCSGENKVSHAVLDSSGRVDDYLFGGPQGASDKSVVHVVQVADSTPLGPE